jgi:hypothetical protein
LVKFWSIVEYQFALIAANLARDLSMASVAKRKHDQMGETINSVSTEFDGRRERYP